MAHILSHCSLQIVTEAVKVAMLIFLKTESLPGSTGITSGPSPATYWLSKELLPIPFLTWACLRCLGNLVALCSLALTTLVLNLMQIPNQWNPFNGEFMRLRDAPISAYLVAGIIGTNLHGSLLCIVEYSCKFY